MILACNLKDGFFYGRVSSLSRYGSGRQLSKTLKALTPKVVFIEFLYIGADHNQIYLGAKLKIYILSMKKFKFLKSKIKICKLMSI